MFQPAAGCAVPGHRGSAPTATPSGALVGPVTPGGALVGGDG